MGTKSMKRKTAQHLNWQLHIFYQIYCDDVKNSTGPGSFTDLSPRTGTMLSALGLNPFSSLKAYKEILLLTLSADGKTEVHGALQ